MDALPPTPADELVRQRDMALDHVERRMAEDLPKAEGVAAVEEVAPGEGVTGRVGAAPPGDSGPHLQALVGGSRLAECPERRGLGELFGQEPVAEDLEGPNVARDADRGEGRPELEEPGPWVKPPSAVMLTLAPPIASPIRANSPGRSSATTTNAFMAYPSPPGRGSGAGGHGPETNRNTSIPAETTPAREHDRSLVLPCAAPGGRGRISGSKAT